MLGELIVMFKNKRIGSQFQACFKTGMPNSDLMAGQKFEEYPRALIDTLLPFNVHVFYKINKLNAQKFWALRAN